jgi:hypothetical protein
VANKMNGQGSEWQVVNEGLKKNGWRGKVIRGN